jgi:carboxylesterase type B
LQSNLGEDAAAKLLSIYGISPRLSDSDALDRVLDILSAVGFYAPAIVYSKAFQGRSYLIHFDEKNPFPGPIYGRASHGLDVAYLFQNFNDHLGPEGVVAAKEFGTHLIGFISGKPRWKKYDSEGTALAFVDGQAKEVGFSEFDGRKTDIWEVIEEVGGDKLISVIFGYMIRGS